MMRSLSALTVFAVAVAAQQASSGYSSASSVTSALSSQSTASTNATSSTSGPATHTIAVGKGGNTFSPDVTLAVVGDIIEFDFYPSNHSVARAAYGYPCVPYEMVLGAGHYGFWSGFEPVDAIYNQPPTYSIRVNTTEPIFYYCGAPGSCTTYGMVGVINPNASTSLAHQRQLAEASTYTLVPGEDWPSEGAIPSGVATTTTSSTPSATASTAPAATTTAAAPKSAELGAGAIAGIAIGAAAVLLAGGIAIWFCGRSSRTKTTAPSGPAQEVMPGYNGSGYPMYSKHMSTVSGYSMPPGYDPRSSGMPHQNRTPVDPMMEQNVGMLGNGLPSPQMQNTNPAPVYSQPQSPNMYAVGTHHVAPVEMAGETMRSPERKSIDKVGVERYS